VAKSRTKLKKEKESEKVNSRKRLSIKKRPVGGNCGKIRRLVKKLPSQGKRKVKSEKRVGERGGKRRSSYSPPQNLIPINRARLSTHSGIGLLLSNTVKAERKAGDFLNADKILDAGHRPAFEQLDDREGKPYRVLTENCRNSRPERRLQKSQVRGTDEGIISTRKTHSNDLKGSSSAQTQGARKLDWVWDKVVGGPRTHPFGNDKEGLVSRTQKRKWTDTAKSNSFARSTKKKIRGRRFAPHPGGE